MYLIRFSAILILTLVFFGMAKAFQIDPMSLFTLIAFVLSLDLIVVRTLSVLYFKGLAALDAEKKDKHGDN